MESKAIFVATVVDSSHSKMIGKQFRQLSEAVNWCSKMCSAYPSAYAKVSRKGQVVWRLKIS